MKLILVRHGETKENVLNIIQGQQNSRLTKKGVLQAKKIAHRLKNEKIDFVYSSDLDRCVHTAQEILKFHPHLKLKISPFLREQGKGIYEGKPSGTMTKMREKTGTPWHQFKPRGGESMVQVQQRTKTFFKEIIDKHQNKTVLIVAHGGPLVSLFLLLFEEGFENYPKYQLGNTAVTFLEIESFQKHKVHVLNCVKHLKISKA